MTPREQGPRARRAAPALVYAGAWALFASVYMGLFASSGVPASMAARSAVAAALPNALLGLVSLRLARRWPWPVEGRWRLATHLVPALLGLAVASTVGWLLLIAADGKLVTGAARWPAAPIVLWQGVVNTLIHVALMGIGYAWHTAGALRRAEDRAARADVLRARAELHLLRSQMHPHFVLNTLHALLGLVRRDPGRAEGALERLGDLLRFGQSVSQSGDDFVLLSQEWGFVRSYLDLERIRLGERLTVSMRADDAALEVPVPPFTLQPLVENAIIHAVAPRASGGCVEISASREGGRLCLTVKDDGPGASEAAIGASPRMGLRLLQERLAALYAGRASLSFDSPAGGGWRARLELPDDAGPEVG